MGDGPDRRGWPAPRRAALRRAAPRRVAPRRVASHRTAPHRTGDLEDEAGDPGRRTAAPVILKTRPAIPAAGPADPDNL
jgi:hypothetical protein